MPPVLHIEFSTAATDYEQATLFNVYFHSVFTQSSITLPPIYEIPAPEASLTGIVISEGIRPNILKKCSCSLSTCSSPFLSESLYP